MQHICPVVLYIASSVIRRLVPFRALVTGFGNPKSIYHDQGDTIQCCFENAHKSETDYVILDSQKWDFEI